MRPFARFNSWSSLCSSTTNARARPMA